MRKLVQSLASKMGYRIEKIRDQLPGPHLQIVDLLLARINDVRAGNVRFIQIGAHDGQYQDPLYDWICRHPWRGVLVEPQPGLYKKLVELHADRPLISIEQAVVSDRAGKAGLWMFKDSPVLPERASVYASLDKAVFMENIQRVMPQFVNLATSIEVEAFRLEDLMRKHGFDDLDLLQIDAEGFDFNIIKMIDFARCHPQIINYEHANLSEDDQRTCRRYLANYGYVFASMLGDTMACRQELL